MGGRGPRESKDPPKLEVPPALAASAALIVAVLGAVGVSGDALTRAVRNNPLPLGVVIVLVLVVVGATTAYLNRANRVVAFAFGILTALLVATVALGADALGEREQPSVSLSGKTDGDLVTVTVKASGSSLKSKETMLVQIHALERFPEDSEESDTCTGSRFEDRRDDARVWPGPLLLWEQGGPDPGGSVAIDSTVEVPAGEYEGVCAFVALSVDGNDPRFVRSYLRFPAPN